jgi:hypothetical protein
MKSQPYYSCEKLFFLRLNQNLDHAHVALIAVHRNDIVEKVVILCGKYRGKNIHDGGAFPDAQGGGFRMITNQVSESLLRRGQRPTSAIIQAIADSRAWLISVGIVDFKNIQPRFATV